MFGAAKTAVGEVLWGLVIAEADAEFMDLVETSVGRELRVWDFKSALREESEVFRNESQGRAGPLASVWVVWDPGYFVSFYSRLCILADA